MKIYAAETYLKEITKLTKKKALGYMSVEKDIKKWFKKHSSIEEIWQTNEFLRDVGNIRLIKVRIINSQSGKGSSSGYRLVLCCNKKSNFVALLYVFPKRGTYARITIEDDDEIEFLEAFINEMKEGTISPHKEIEKLVSEKPAKSN